MIALDFFFFFGDFSDSGLTALQSSNRSVFALIPKLTQDNQNQIEITEK